jgi:hypothetical protein
LTADNPPSPSRFNALAEGVLRGYP